MEMGSNVKVSYQRLRPEVWIDENDDIEIREKVIGRFRSSRSRRVHVRRKLRIKIPSLRRFLRRKARVLKIGWCKILERLKESQSHFGDLFAGNYLFMQVTPTTLKGSAQSHSRYSLPKILHDEARGYGTSTARYSN